MLKCKIYSSFVNKDARFVSVLFEAQNFRVEWVFLNMQTKINKMFPSFANERRFGLPVTLILGA